jgi:hypothetical protein
MKQYHTSITINASIGIVWQTLTDFSKYSEWNPLVGRLEGEIKEGAEISTYIIPLKKTYQPKLIVFKKNSEIIWKGVQGASFFLAGKHYYKLESLAENTTKLLHGEYFTGILSIFIPQALLSNMENAFQAHNLALKQRVENDKK